MMNVVIAGGSSECRSGCESGWTLYLEHSTSNYSVSSNKKGSDKNHFRSNKQQKMAAFDDDDEQYQKNNEFIVVDDDDEDLSMVSDASSGPPHFDHDIDDDDEVEVVFCCNSSGRKRQSMKLSSTPHQFFKAQDFALDDTASSPNFISKKNGGQNNGSSLKRMIDYSSQGFSATHLNQERSNNFRGHYGLIQSPLSSTKQFQPNQKKGAAALNMHSRKKMTVGVNSFNRLNQKDLDKKNEKTKKRLKGMIMVPNLVEDNEGQKK